MKAKDDARQALQAGPEKLRKVANNDAATDHELQDALAAHYHLVTAYHNVITSQDAALRNQLIVRSQTRCLAMEVLCNGLGTAMGGGGMRGDGARGGTDRSPQGMVKRLDTSGDGAISSSEYTSSQKEAFGNLDTDGNGKLNADELRSAWGGTGTTGGGAKGPNTSSRARLSGASLFTVCVTCRGRRSSRWSLTWWARTGGSQRSAPGARLYCGGAAWPPHCAR